MTYASRELLVVGTLTILGLVGQHVFASISFILTVPSIVALRIESPVLYLGLFALFGELFSTLPPGVVALAIFTPFFLKRFLPLRTFDFSFSYAAALFGALALQLLILFSPDIFRAWQSSDAIIFPLLDIVGLIPWVYLGGVLWFSGCYVFLTSLILHNFRWP